MKEKKKSTVGTIIKIVFFTIATVFLLIAGTIVYKAYKYPDKVPDIFGIKPMIVLSGSMETSIYTGDLVFAKIVDPNTLENNDIIAFRNENDKVTTHRIVEIVNEDGTKKFKTKGDNNNTEDANLVETSDVEGIYIGRIPKVGNFLLFMQKPIGLIVVLLIILVIGLIWLYIANKKDDKKFRIDEKERKEFEEFKKKKALEDKENNE